MPKNSFSIFGTLLVIVFSLTVCVVSSVTAQETKTKPNNNSAKQAQKKASASKATEKVQPKNGEKTGDKKDKEAREKERASKRAEVKQRFDSLSNDRKAELVEFVKQNHPQLEKLMKRLKNKQAFSYQQAVCALDRDVTRLQNIEQRAPDRHKLALEEWKLKSRIDVMAVQWALNDSKQKRKSLKELIGQMIDLNLKQQELERKNVAKRLASVDKRIGELKSGREAAIERRLKWVEKKAKDMQFASQKKAKNSPVKKSSKKTIDQK